MKRTFQIHRQLVRDCHRLGRFEHCHVLLHRNASLHWFIAVPQTDVPDLLELPPGIRSAVVAECAQLSAFLKGRLQYPKVNFAGIGNVVPQLHLHVVGRRVDDPAWPAPVWGNLPPGPPYPASQVRTLIRWLRVDVGLRGTDRAGRDA